MIAIGEINAAIYTGRVWISINELHAISTAISIYTGRVWISIDELHTISTAIFTGRALINIVELHGGTLASIFTGREYIDGFNNYAAIAGIGLINVDELLDTMHAICTESKNK
jgi:hypothetical protein